MRSNFYVYECPNCHYRIGGLKKDEHISVSDGDAEQQAER